MRLLSRLSQQSIVQGLAASVLISLLVLAIRALGWFEAVDLKAYDGLLRSRPSTEVSDPRVAYIEVTEQDIQRQGRWPITDAVLAETLERIGQAGPRAIGLDIYRDIDVPPGRAELDRYLSTHANVIVVMKVGEERSPGIAPPAILRGSDQTGFNDMLVDQDGIVRRGILFLDEGAKVHYGFALRLALLYLLGDGIAPGPDPVNPEFLRLGSVTLRPFESSDGGYVQTDANGYQFLLDYQGARAKPVTHSLSDLLAGRVPPEALKNKVVLVGVHAPSVPDLFHTPFTAAGGSGEIMPGVELHGLVVSQLLRTGLQGQRPMSSLSEIEEGVWVVLWGLLAGISVRLGRSPWTFTLVGLAGLAGLAGVTILLFWQGWWLPVVPATVNWTACAAVMTASVLSAERKQRAMLMNLFSRHVSEEIAEAIWQQREQFLDGGRPRSQKMMVSVLFSDFKGYTSMAEKMDPQTLMDWINSYVEAMAGVIGVHEGVVDDYAGDGIKANFGVPVPRQGEDEIAAEARRAVRCAVAMARQLAVLNTTWESRGFQSVGMRIGIATGSVVSGSLGSVQRLKYTTVGDTVNAAARLESLDLEKVSMTSGSACRILIDERTRVCVGGEFEVESIGEVMVKGKQQPLLTFRVLGETAGR
jgi:adenylate cyclase